ncbi:cellulase family glycosylhydrolase [Pseudoalteromonas shioyasakiensis]|uniref:cellulase family glycosylhydrolase n=1 Tax=Pseudoalteromonas shioyasakiensis TaxID=1190813 RepID=UPI0021195915|nr:cellulase family glycosylhydrolase [Pseudoalteromonas shioyasakiensis]MCQ8877581.1 cellulase family glycosylhydrolase [Pseudoalteromonas shioyasakiensis]
MKKVLLLCALFFIPFISFADGFDYFITADNGRLKNGDEDYRFISFNVPTLNFQEDEMAFTVKNPYRLPNEFEMRDIFSTVKEMGGQVIRIYTIPVKNNNFPKDAPTYVEAPGKFNEEAFKVTDMMLALANEYEIRIIFPLLNNRQWMGGRPNYAEFRGKTAEDFWVDKQLRDDFKKTIKYTLNRKNTITGEKYKDDKAILAWETGNELTSPIEWTVDITRYIKSLDKNHLVMDGWFSDDLDEPVVREESLTEWSIDIVSSHHYERDASLIPQNIQKNIDLVKGRKVYMVGEFGFASSSAIESALDKVIDEPSVAGALIWSLRHRRREGGFYWHSEPLGAGLFKAFRWPGFESGLAYDEQRLMTMYRNKAFEIQNAKPAEISIPAAPKLLPIENLHSINWQGSMGATGYNVERAKSDKGPWTLVGYNVSDADVPYFPLFHDETAQLNTPYFYRVAAINSAGKSTYSNVVGPVESRYYAKIDTMKNLGVVETSKALFPTTGNDRSFKEIRNRLFGDYGSEAIYKVPGKLAEFKLFAFEKTRFSYLSLEGSNDKKKWLDLNVKPSVYANSESNYGYWKPKIYAYKAGTPFKYIKVIFKGGEAHLARTEILYTDK